MNTFKSVAFSDVNIRKGFWADRIRCNEETTIYAVRDRFIDTGRFEAFRFNWTEGSEVPKPHFFWDSDVAKWIESAAYILMKKDDRELRRNIDELIDLIEKNQCDDGYFNIYHTIVEPEKRFRCRDNHELYCLGHLIEAAVAYYNAVKSDRLIKIVDKYIDLVIRVFCEEKSAAFSTPGHEEIELALIKLFRLKKDRKYLDLAMFFINERGKSEEQETSWYNSAYNQSHLPVRQQREAQGHCVRACYLYSAMADAAAETGDSELLSACKALFDDIVSRKMYISGGIGSSHHGEAFTIPYDLPNDSAYAETCAAISMLMFADRMKNIELDSKYADIVEREMYNGIISGISLDGTAFFYENPLEINLEMHNRHISLKGDNERFPITTRRRVFSCSCCPPNMTRFLETVGDHIFTYNDDCIIVHQFTDCEAEFDGVRVDVATEYPKDGRVKIRLTNAKARKLYIRKPDWCKKISASDDYTMHNGYAVFSINENDAEITVDFCMKVSYYSASPLVKSDSGKIAVMYGPVLYCMERLDNSFCHSEICLDVNGAADVVFDEYFGCNVILHSAAHKLPCQSLYFNEDELRTEPVCIKLIPYFGFANRGESDMAVWLNR